MKIDQHLLDLVLYAKLFFNIPTAEDIRNKVAKTKTKTYYPQNWEWK